MIRIALLSLGTLNLFGFAATAQSFSHSHGHSGYHSHDTTIHVTRGTCCHEHHCGSRSHSHSRHHGHSSHSSHGSHSSHHSPRTRHVTRTYTRTYVHPHTTTRTYTRTVQPTHITRYYVTPQPKTVHYYAPHEQHLDDRTIYHNDRGEAWAHYDRKWKSRTNTRRHHKHD